MFRLNVKELEADFQAGLKELAGDLKAETGEEGVLLKAVRGDKNRIERQGDRAEIIYTTKVSFFRLVRILCENGRRSYFTYEEEQVFEELTMMADNSRNAVLSVAGAKTLLRKLALMGYTGLQLYTEDTYEVQGEPYFGYLRGRYSGQEIREIDKYAMLFGIELIPCIQTLAHLRTIYRWEEYYSGAFDCNDVLLVGAERTYRLIENMLRTVSENFTSRRINIGMDEAFMLGRGKYLDKNGYVERGVLLQKHLEKVLSLTEKYGLRPMMWGDMFRSEYEKHGSACPPEGVQLICWDYGNIFQPADYEKDYAGYCAHLNEYRGFCKNAIFAGGAHKYFGFTPHNAYSIQQAKAALDACEACSVKEIMITSWGDTGGETSHLAMLPVLFYYAERMYGHRDEKEFEKAFSYCFGPFDDFMAIDGAGRLSETPLLNTSSKSFLYTDPFLGILDKCAFPWIRECYARAEIGLKKAMRTCKEFRDKFYTQLCLVRALSVKYDLGAKTREAYRRKDRKALEELANKTYPEVLRRIKVFYKAFRAEWFAENKPHGFDIQDARIGALLWRIEKCRERLLSYVRQETERIPELEEEILDAFKDPARLILSNWGELISPNTMIEYFSYV